MTVLKITGGIAAFALLTSPALAQAAPAMEHSKMDHSSHDMSEMDVVEEAGLIAEDAAIITAKVNGLVCDFCAQSLRKVFKKEDSVDSIAVDLDSGEVRVVLKAGAAMDDARVKKLIRKSGYSLVSIDRSGA